MQRDQYNSVITNKYIIAEKLDVSMQENNERKGFTLAEVLITLGIIGVVAAITLPSIVGKYQKNVTVTRLQKVYSLLSQSLSLAQKDNGEIMYWDFESTSQEFMDKYLSPYFQSIIKIKPSIDTDRYSKSYVLPDGTTFNGWMFKNSIPTAHDITTYYMINVDINGNKKPNVLGRDIFKFYIFPQKSVFYNTGEGNCAKSVPSAGLYPDGYGYSRNTLLNDSWRGCNITSGSVYEGDRAGAFCTALIMMDGWKISDDYKW